MNFAVVNLGCKVNRVESDEAAARLLARGWISSSEESADLIVVNTCTVTGEADKKARKAVRHAVRANDRARILVTGCAVAIDPATYEAMSDRVEVVAKHLLAAKIDSIADENAETGTCGGALLRVGEAFPTRVGIKVQDGCNHACTYCIVHVARGRAVSAPSDDVVREAVAYARAGVKEIVLTGINLGSYRDGEGGRARLSDLLERLLAQTERACEDLLDGTDRTLPRFRLSSIEPMDVDSALVDLMARENGRICRHLHLPLQSGSTKVLREMARPYDAEGFLALVRRLRSAMPSLSLTTDVIVGFPGETDADFAETVELSRAAGFSKMHVFPYSKREGTPAAARPDQVSADAKSARAAELRRLSDELRSADRASRAGTVELALVETDGRAETESYYDIVAPEGARPGSLVRVTM